MTDEPPSDERPEPSERVIRTGVRARGLWASTGAKAFLYAFLVAWCVLAAIHCARGFQPLRGNGALLSVVAALAVIDAFRRTYMELWLEVPWWGRWLFLLFLGIWSGRMIYVL